MKKALVLLLALVLVGSAASLVLAAYPDRPVKLIVPWAAGGDTDNIFRPFGPALQKDRKSTRLNSSHLKLSRMPSSA